MPSWIPAFAGMTNKNAHSLKSALMGQSPHAIYLATCSDLIRLNTKAYAWTPCAVSSNLSGTTYWSL
jgi:hypothetical protein